MKIEDYIALTIIILLGLRISFKGFIAEFSSKSGIIVGVFFIVIFYTPFEILIDNRFGTASTLIAYVSLFFTGFFCTKFLLSILKKVIEILHLSILDNMLGFFLGAAEGSILVVLILYLLSFQNIFTLNFEGCIVVSYLQSYIPLLSNFIIGVKNGCFANLRI